MEIGGAPHAVVINRFGDQFCDDRRDARAHMPVGAAFAHAPDHPVDLRFRVFCVLFDLFRRGKVENRRPGIRHPDGIITDYAYWLYVTDLGVDRDYLHQGIGTELMETAHSLAGGEKDVAVYLVANENAIPFYEKLGMRKADDVMEYNHIEWTEFAVK